MKLEHHQKDYRLTMECLRYIYSILWSIGHLSVYQLALKQLLRKLEKEKVEIEWQLKEIEWRLDQESSVHACSAGCCRWVILSSSLAGCQQSSGRERSYSGPVSTGIHLQSFENRLTLCLCVSHHRLSQVDRSHAIASSKDKKVIAS